MIISRFRIGLVASLLALAATLPLPARATDYTELWWSGEDGWGVNLVQNEDKVFATFYVYGQSLQPTWYSTLMTADSTFSSFTGPLYATSGSFFGKPWKPSEHPTPTLVGTATFTPTSTTTGTLTYDVNNLPGGPVFVANKPIQRFTLATIKLGGTYAGSGIVVVSGCSNAADNGTTIFDVDPQITQLVSGDVGITLAFGTSETCTLSGPSVQEGQLFRMPSASYVCKSGSTTTLNTTATVYEVKATAIGIEGRWSANTGGGCGENGRFSAVLR